MAFKHLLVLRTEQPGIVNLDGVAKVLPPILSQPLYLPSPHYSREFVTKPPRRHARRARGAAKEGGILETVC